jgi:hypothetical protein
MKPQGIALLLALVSAPSALAQTVGSSPTATADPGTTASSSQPVSPAPILIPVDGVARTANGEPRTGQITLHLALYNAASDPSPLWIEDQVVTLGEGGVYQVWFGATQRGGLPARLFSESAAPWLGVTIDQDPELPRTVLVAVPFASRAASADALGTKTATDFVLHENLEQVLEKWTSSGLRASSSSTEVTPSLSTGDVTTPNSIAKYVDAIGTLGEAAILENAGNVTIPGNLGIGNTSPDGRLSVGDDPVGGDANFTSTVAAGGTSAIFSDNTNSELYVRHLSGNMINFDVDFGNKITFSDGGAENVRIDGSGNVGIGTAAPLRKLDVVGNLLFSAANAEIEFNLGGPRIFVPSASTLSFHTGGGTGSAATERMRIVGNGNVGIGTDNPTQRLHVVGHAMITGDIAVDGNIAAKYQDVAEWVDATEPLPAATVVAAHPTLANQVRRSTKAYDTTVLGVVSSQPGLLLGVRGDSKVMVAQSGRVKVAVDARFGAIKPGDLLVASPIPGVAMRSRPTRAGLHRPGTIIGKALEARPTGRGEILVLLTLQ